MIIVYTSEELRASTVMIVEGYRLHFRRAPDEDCVDS